MYSIGIETFFKLFREIGIVNDGNMTAGNDVKVLISLINAFKCKRILEIGINKGYTAKDILKYSPYVTEYIGIDIPYENKSNVFHYQQIEVPNIPGEKALDDNRLRIILRDGGITNIDKFELGKFDFIFIDGDHSYEGVKRDTEFCDKYLLNDNGIITWHDFSGLDTVTPYIRDEYNNISDGRIWWVQGTCVAFRVGGL